MKRSRCFCSGPRLRLRCSGEKDLLHVALVGLDHFLRRVTHRIVRVENPCGVWLFCLFSQITGDVTRAAFEFPEVLFRRFPGEDLDLKQHSRVVFRRHEDLTDILVDELLCDDPLRRVALGVRQDSADFVDLLLEGVSLGGCLLQFCDFLFGFFNFTIAVRVIFLKSAFVILSSAASCRSLFFFRFA